MKSINLPLLVSLIAVATLNSVAKADTSWQKKVQPFNKGTHPKLPPTKLDYTFSWNGAVQAGLITVEFNKIDTRNPKYEFTQAFGRSTGLAYAAFPYNFNFTSFTDAKTSKPSLFLADEKDKREKIKTQNRFTSSGVNHKADIYKFSTKKTKQEAHKFKFANSHDPLSAIQFIRRQPLKNGNKLHLALHPMGSPMYSEVTVLGREKHAGRSCIKLDVRLNKIDLRTMNLIPYTKMKKATLWISDDADRILVEMRTKVFIGDIRMTLDSQKRL